MAIITLDPTNGEFGSTKQLAMAPRPSTLRGATLGIVANGLGRSESMFDALADQLEKWDELAGRVKIVKPNVSVPPWPDQWAEITRRVDGRCDWLWRLRFVQHSKHEGRDRPGERGHSRGVHSARCASSCG